MKGDYALCVHGRWIGEQCERCPGGIALRGFPQLAAMLVKRIVHGECTVMCVGADEQLCTCRCRGEYHGLAPFAKHLMTLQWYATSA
jgi:hypothetical protein